MARKPGVWFPVPKSVDSIEWLGPGLPIPNDQLMGWLCDPLGEELRHKVGVTGARDGSAKLTTRLLQIHGWFFKTDHAKAGPELAPIHSSWMRQVELASRTPFWHPQKSWFLIVADPLVWPVSISPVLRTLREHTDIDHRFELFARMIGWSLEISRDLQIGLDVNPSNFGTEGDSDRLVYLDDETYPPLQLRDVAEAISARIPEEPTVSTPHWQLWGKRLQSVFQPFCTGIDEWLELITGIRDYPLTDRFIPARESVLGGLLQGHPRLDRSMRGGSITIEIRHPVVPVAPIPPPIANPPAAAQPMPPESISRNPAPIVPVPAIELPSPVEVPPWVPPLPPQGGLTCVFADVHGNLPALEAVLSYAEELGVDEYLFLGDVVGYGPFPNECIRRLQGLPRLTAIRGNHDHFASQPEFRGEDFNRVAREALRWTRDVLGAAEREWLANLPVEAGIGNWRAYHGAPYCPDRFSAYVYEPTYRDNLNRLEQMGVQVCFYGHTHVPFIHRRSSFGDEKLTPDPMRLFRPGETLLINPGSVGQPRDGDSRAAILIWDRRTDWVRFHRIDYPLESMISANRAAGLPDDLSARLEIGR
ncbi:metallophosphoesterase family protein [Tuwongella immobilis]|uniref:Calcineurin-like phosphoesterase domain-containing protein n=1 Tax=Tuwongella immobilis TaxID=692036 RepID=A0A6C2YQA8_9BACT|nr:metallophosphoesterase family protein [Tuwongella immobilis]VIP03537.1 Putative phosphoesterase OS=Beggiatoa alba B18LD GN=BegalDRAFT_3502 PE=4 SV=1: Metallophos_2 [Tuwongella immobilis]VTS04442.1 Putative phosphoesterase OS=Beggiatoa alba B18LD GN=BegalDRAFT_3502 PE=4 SV=1: Metallophos_2 [Tuwongella immobilis]